MSRKATLSGSEGSMQIKLMPWELQEDLATVACYAAGEIDDAILGRPRKFEAVTHLVEAICNSIAGISRSRSRQCIVDPRTAVAVGQALENSYLGSSITTVNELVQKSRQFISLLKQLAEDPEKMRANKMHDLENMRSLCLALSNSALTCEEPLYDRSTGAF